MSARARVLLCGLIVLLGVALWPGAAAARVVGRVVHVGFPASIGHVVRRGAWMPVVVDLGLEGQAAFDGFLRAEQPDKDGDLVFDQVRVQLREESGASRRYVLYCVARPGGLGPVPLSVDVLDENGVIVEVVDEPRGELVRSLKLPQSPEAIGDSGYLILAVTPRVTGKIEYLTTPDQQDKFDRRMVVAHLQPGELPDRWQGLEAVNCIVWDAADATQLTGRQLEALVRWVRHGGLLMLAASDTADTLAKSKQLGPILPVEIGPASSTTRLGELRKSLLGVKWLAEEQDRAEDLGRNDDRPRRYYRRPLPFVMCRTAEGARTVLHEDELDATMVARRAVDRGEVVFVAAKLEHLLKTREGIRPVEFFKKTLQLRQPRTVDATVPNASDLFPYLDGAVGFRRSTGLYLLGALLFSIAYVGVATFGSWSFLRSRGWTRHAWPAFAVVAGAAAALSLLAVQSMRGVGQSLQQLTIVDATAGGTAATATAYFGLKTGTHTVLDAWMPSDYAQLTEPERTDCYLKPMPLSADPHAAGSGYADPARYRLVPSSAVLRDVPIRATLKQFEGHWFGNLRRTIEADIAIIPRRDDSGDQEDGISDDSTITNHVGCTLKSCFLIQPLANPFRSLQDTTPRGSEQTLSRVLVHEVGNLADGEEIRPADRIYYDPNGDEWPVEQWSGRTLAEFQKNWGNKLRGGLSTPFARSSDGVRNLPLENYQDALLMATTISEHAPRNLKGAWGGGHDFLARHCRQLDLSDRLTTDYVLLIGFAEDQGPVMLCTRKGGRAFKPLAADRAYTLYRFLIPVRRL